MSRYQLKNFDVKVSDAFIEKFAQLYIKQRSCVYFDYASVDEAFLFDNHDFSGNDLRAIIKRNSVAIDIKREAGERPTIIRDIYRSDLGEMLLTYYFEEKLPVNERFRIPKKNITTRELANMPGRGLDAIGFRERDGKIDLFLGEAKVSSEGRNPPQVVDASDDSIYKTQKRYLDERSLLLQRLSDHCRRLTSQDAAKLGALMLLMDANKQDRFDIYFGCCLVRDTSCCKVNEDYGVFYTQQTDFEPYQLGFCLLSFDKQIADTVDLFYAKVQELCNR